MLVIVSESTERQKVHYDDHLVSERSLADVAESTEHPKISHAILLVQASTNGEYRNISTVRLQTLKEWKPNCMRHFPTTLQDERHEVH